MDSKRVLTSKPCAPLIEVQSSDPLAYDTPSYSAQYSGCGI